MQPQSYMNTITFLCEPSLTQTSSSLVNGPGLIPINPGPLTKDGQAINPGPLTKDGLNADAYSVRARRRLRISQAVTARTATAAPRISHTRGGASLAASKRRWPKKLMTRSGRT